MAAPSNRHTPALVPQSHPWEDTGEIVGLYVAQLGSTPRTARTGVHVDPWVDVR
ncbi:hypothetical protein ACIHCQ_39120 [Streptomyces sp. NPDC052236]|uniref:hypothetical protein n=1 Tax=Streptomyces sp. NPDC052236 TaxID=3365686 RepID=UPI0037D260C5